MPDDFMCPECRESHDGPGICSECGVGYVDLSGFDLDEGVKVSKMADDADPLAVDDSGTDGDREEVPEAA